MVSHDLQTIFIHIPKTGGSSIEALIWPDEDGRTEADLWMGFLDRYHNKYQTGGLQHLLAVQIRQELGIDIFNQYFKFAMVRNPWDKAVSQYRFMRLRPDLMEFIGMQADDCFKRYLHLIRKKEHVQWMAQYKFVMDDNGELLVDYIGRFESFSLAVDKALKKVGLTYSTLPHINQSDGRIPVALDAEATEWVADMYRQDIDIFNYK